MRTPDIFELLLRLPLFNGLSKPRLRELLETVPLDFSKTKQGECIVSAGTGCDTVVALLKGKCIVEAGCSTGNPVISYSLSAPCLFGVELLYGMDHSYPFNVFAKSDCSTLNMSKQSVLNLLKTDEVCLINCLNILSYRAQKPWMSLKSNSPIADATPLSLMLDAIVPKTAKNIEITWTQG